MVKISKNIRNNKRSKTVVSVKVQKTKVTLRIGNISIVLPRVTAVRVHRSLGRALVIQDTKRN